MCFRSCPSRDIYIPFLGQSVFDLTRDILAGSRLKFLSRVDQMA